MQQRRGHRVPSTPAAASFTNASVRLSPLSTSPWDNAVLVPIESVWGLHGLGNGHPDGIERVGPPWEQPAGVPAIVVKPRSVAGA